MWLTSCYLNKQVRKPLALCIGDIRVDSQLLYLINRIQTQDTSWHEADTSPSTHDASPYTSHSNDMSVSDNSAQPNTGMTKWSFRGICLKLCIAIFQVR